MMAVAGLSPARWGTVPPYVRYSLLTGLSVAILTLLYAFDPAADGIFPACLLYDHTGLYCPGCGSTRAAHQLLHGDLYAAFRLNPLLVTALPAIIYALSQRLIPTVAGRRLPRPAITAGRIRLLLAVIVLYTVFRNIPVFPFNLLAPWP